MKNFNFKPSCHFYAFFTVSIWAGANVINRLIAVNVSSISVTTIRFLLASAAMLVIILIKRVKPPTLREIPYLFVAGASGFALYTVAITNSAQTINASTSSLVVAVAPIMTAILALFIFSEKIAPLGWVAIALAFCGMLFLTLYSGTLSVNKGLIWAFISALSMCCYNLVSRKLTRNRDPLSTTAYAIFAATIIQIGFAPRAFRELATSTPWEIVALLYLGIFSSALGYLLWSMALATAKRTSDATNWMFVTPLFTTLLSAVSIKEFPDMGTVIGGALILTGLVLFNKSKATTEIKKA